MIIQLPPEQREEVVTSLGKGNVLFWKDKAFYDKSGSKDSYIIILTEITQNEFFFVIRGTANKEIYDTSWGRKRERFILEPGEGNLPKETVLDFEYIYRIEKEKIIEEFSIKAQHIGKISLGVLDRLVKKIEQSKTVNKWMKAIIRESRQSEL